MTITALAVPAAQYIAPLAPAVSEALNARQTAKSAATIARINVYGQIAGEAIQTVSVLVTEYAGMRAEQHRHLEAMQQHARARAAIEAFRVVMEAELAQLAATDRGDVAHVLADCRRDLMALAGISTPPDNGLD